MSKIKAGFVAFLGRPNAGKSTLLNALVGERLAAVSPKAQTTRKSLRGIRTDTIHGETTQIVFVDLPGLYIPPEGKSLNRAYVEDALAALRGIDILLYLVDLSREFLGTAEHSDEAFIIREVQRLRAADPNLVVVVALSKADLVVGDLSSRVATLSEALKILAPQALLPISSKDSSSHERLLVELRRHLPEHPLYYDAELASDETVRDLAAELIHEQLFHNLGEEIPYECAVEVINFVEPSGQRRKTEIHANIHVERPSQRQIVLGAGGKKIKEIGQAARISLEELLQSGVVLKLFVKHSPGWTRDPRRMREFGYLRNSERGR